MKEQAKTTTYLDHILAFEDRLAYGQYEDLTSTDIALYRALCAICNKVAMKRYKGIFKTGFRFQASFTDIHCRSHVSINALEVCRRRLKDAGLIDYSKGGGRSVASVYIVKRLTRIEPDKQEDGQILSQNCDSINQILSQNCDSFSEILSQNCDSKPHNTVTKLGASKDIKDIVCRENEHTQILISEKIPESVRPTTNEWFQHLKQKQGNLTNEQIRLQMKNIIQAVQKYGDDKVVQMIELAISNGSFNTLKFDTLAKDFRQSDRITLRDDQFVN